MENEFNKMILSSFRCQSAHTGSDVKMILEWSVVLENALGTILKNLNNHCYMAAIVESRYKYTNITTQCGN